MELAPSGPVRLKSFEDIRRSGVRGGGGRPTEVLRAVTSLVSEAARRAKDYGSKESFQNVKRIG